MARDVKLKKNKQRHYLHPFLKGLEQFIPQESNPLSYEQVIFLFPKISFSNVLTDQESFSRKNWTE